MIHKIVSGGCDKNCVAAVPGICIVVFGTELLSWEFR
jgi:hypothetical protein